jgi:protein TonB
MMRSAAQRDERRQWLVSSGVALVVHAAIVGAIVSSVSLASPQVPEPVVLVELPPMTDVPELPPTMERTSNERVVTEQVVDSAEPRVEQSTTRPLIAPTQQPRIAPVLPNTAPMAAPAAAPIVRAPLPSNPLTVAPAASGGTPAQTPSASPAAPVASPAVGAADPNARRQEVNYFALISSHLNRRKTYPAEARQARQQGVVSIRFTVDRSGGVSNISVRRSSGHTILDQATIALLQRVAPLPRMPASMQRESVTITLPIEYSLTTN